MRSNLTFRLPALLMMLALSGLSVKTSCAQDKKDDAAPKSSTAASSTVAFMNNMEALNDKRKLGVGDVLSLRVVEDEDAAHTIIVTDSGEMEVPYIGRVDATGKTCRQLAHDIKRMLEQQYYYKATVIIGLDSVGSRTASRGRLYVMGQVKSEGPQEIPADENYTLSKAILRAGGFAQYADKKKVKVMRPSKTGKGDSETIIVNCAEILDKGMTSKDIPVEPEDVIVVPEKLINL